MHSDTEYMPIEFPVSHLLQNQDQSVAFRTTTLFTIGWQPVHNFLLMTGGDKEIMPQTDRRTERQRYLKS